MKTETGNFQECIHQVDFTSIYQEKKLLSGDILNDYYREKESLNGEWNYGIDQYDNCLRSKWYEEKYVDEDGRPYPVDFSFDLWDKMYIPSCWNMIDKLFYYEGSIVFTRKFRYINRGESHVFIKFGGVNYDAKVFINGQFMGMHRGGSTPFYVNATEALKEDNRILVVVNNRRERDRVPCENTDWFNYGGIYRDVELIRLSENYIKNVHVELVAGSAYEKVRVAVEVKGQQINGTANVYIEELGVKADILVSNGYGEIVFAAKPNLWSPEQPTLYDVLVTYEEDSLKERVGFREIEVKGKEIFLNGENIFLKGICAHEESLKNGKAVTEEEVRENYSIAKEMNCNYMRLAHYPHAEAAARIADEVGIMLWEEIPVYWAIAFDNEPTWLDAKNQLEELIIRDRNRASVIIWSVGNENADTDERLSFMSGLVAVARELDKSRLISAACLVDLVQLKIVDRLADHVDIIGLNEYYGWYEPDFARLIEIFENSNPQKPVVITEFGADAKSGARGSSDELHTEDGQLDIYRKQIEVFKQISWIRGISPWILFDFRCPRRLQVMQNYYNIKGLLSADKKHRKPAFFAMQEFYKDVK
jgi:Beta-galactosidase/beta-glucuronidase